MFAQSTQVAARLGNERHCAAARAPPVGRRLYVHIGIVVVDANVGRIDKLECKFAVGAALVAGRRRLDESIAEATARRAARQGAVRFDFN